MGGSSRLHGAHPARAGLVGAVLLAVWPGFASAEGLHLSRIPTSRIDAGEATGGPLRLRVFVPDPEGLASRLAPAVESVGADHVELALGSYPELEPRSPEGYLGASFLIDFDEPEVRALRDELEASRGPVPGPGELRSFTWAAIPRKTLERGWDAASRVARSGMGDCTEHAVLLTALARAAGWPARVALGLVVVEAEGGPQAFGHAWAELHQDGHWLPVEATLAGEETEVLGHLPLLLLADEGPGYALGLGRELQRSWARRVEIGADAPSGEPLASR